tara:strand:+ start:3903 stop:4094 length:192 start_codon:yes stop_codon:yes gene_type:complete
MKYEVGDLLWRASPQMYGIVLVIDTLARRTREKGCKIAWLGDAWHGDITTERYKWMNEALTKL